MGRLLLASLLVLSFKSFSADHIIISDLDDTIKVTNVSDTAQAAYNAAFTRKVFGGVPELVQTLEKESEGFYVLTNSPNIFRDNIEKLLEKFDIVPVDLSTRSLTDDSDKFKYKYNYIAKKIEETGKSVILFGDDVGEDPEVYVKIKKDFPGKVKAIYIHVIEDRKLPEGVQKYHTFLDIALFEYESGRLNLSQVTEMDELFNSVKMKKVFPKFKHCPENWWRVVGEGEISSLVENMTEKVIKFCKNR